MPENNDNDYEFNYKPVETYKLPEWFYVRGQLDYDNQPAPVKIVIDSLMCCICDGVNPNDILNTLAQLICLVTQMSTADDLDVDQIHYEREKAIRSVANSLPDIFLFHAKNMPEALKHISKEFDLFAQGEQEAAFLGNGGEAVN